jgi:hypothetical protein
MGCVVGGVEREIAFPPELTSTYDLSCASSFFCRLRSLLVR